MSPRNVIRMTSAGFVLGGVLLAAWTIISPWGSFAGAELGASPQWKVAHTCHYLAALSMLFGLVGLAVQRLTRADGFETFAQLGFVFAMWVYGGTGAITSFIWPMIAKDAGYIVQPDGQMFKPHPEFLQTNAVPVLAIGIAVLVIAMYRVGLMPLIGMASALLGGALFFVPTAPLSTLPWIFFPAAGTFTGLGLVILGYSLRNGAVPATAPPAPATQPAPQPAAV